MPETRPQPEPEWAGRHLTFHIAQSTEDMLSKVEWITVRNADGTEEHWPVQATEVIHHDDGTVGVKFKALTTDPEDT